MRLALLTALVVLALAAPSAAQLWRWTDAEGVVRYTNDVESIPPEYRDRATDIGSPTGREEEPEPATEPTIMPFTDGGPIKASVHLNGVPLTLMLDTGADRTVISPSAVARAGLAAEGGREVQIVGVTGSTTASEVVVPLLDVAGARVGPLTVIVHDVGVAEVDGLLGRDILDRFTLMLDSAAGRAELRPR